MGRRVSKALGIGTAPTHMEWFYGPKGLRFSEIGCRPPGVGQWDSYCAGNEIDLYREWALAVCYGTTERRPSRRYACGIIALRPDRDGRIAGYEGTEGVFRQYGDNVVGSHFPEPGTPTQPVEAGYMANAWMRVRHPDYDTLRGDPERHRRAGAGAGALRISACWSRRTVRLSPKANSRTADGEAAVMMHKTLGAGLCAIGLLLGEHGDRLGAGRAGARQRHRPGDARPPQDLDDLRVERDPERPLRRARHPGRGGRTHPGRGGVLGDLRGRDDLHLPPAPGRASGRTATR